MTEESEAAADQAAAELLATLPPTDPPAGSLLPRVAATAWTLLARSQRVALDALCAPLAVAMERVTSAELADAIASATAAAASPPGTPGPSASAAHSP